MRDVHRLGSWRSARSNVIGALLLGSAALGCTALGCSGPDELGWRTHPCPEPEAGDAPPFLPLIDGLVDEWTEEQASAEDPVGDANAQFDVMRVVATSRGAELFVYFEIDRVLNLYAGSANDGNLVLELHFPDGRRMSIDFRNRHAVLGSGAVVPWQALGLVSAPSHAASTFELRFDMSAFGGQPGGIVELDFSGSDTLAEPLRLPLRYAASEVVGVDDGRAPGTRWRVASLNTREAGLFDPARAAPIARLLRAAGADVFLLQELGETTPEEVEAALEMADPHGDGRPWHALAEGAGSILGNGIASNDALVALPLGTNRALGAVVLSTPPVAVLSVHLKCCGYLDSSEDEQRLQQVAALTQQITRFRLGQLSAELAPFRHAPIVIAGDFNDVGSPELFSELVSPRVLGLTRFRLPHLSARDVFTWHGYESDFPPATLDAMLYGGLEPLAGFVLDSGGIPRERLDALGLWGGDSNASDHLMLVGDFR